METKRLYYTDSYLTKAKSRVSGTSHDGLHVALEQTIFYPTSGGQPHDVGTLNGIQVLDVVDEGSSIVHVLSSPLAGNHVEGEILWRRRYDHMQQHTGQHLLSAVFESLFEIPTLSFRMSEESSSIELEAQWVTAGQVEAATIRAAELARANPAIGITFEEASHAGGLRKASERAGILRIVEIPGVDRSACGGTHVASLAEVLPLQIRELDKVRGHVRIHFVCGNRAIDRARSDFETVSRIATALGTSPDRAEEQTLALKQSLAESEKQRLRLESEAALRTGMNLYAGTIPDTDGIRRLVLAEPVIDERARQKAKAFSSRPGAVLLLHSPEGLLLACSPDSGVNAGAVLKQALARYGARGGGSGMLAQGSLPDPAVVDELQKLLRPEAI